MDKIKVLKNVEKYAFLVKDYLSPKQIILYGSYAKGTASENSDIDIAVVLENLKGDYLDISKNLYKLRRNIDDRIEPVLIIESCDKSGFLKEVQSTGHIIL
jgi:predicted nucleotidyltransferase